MPERATQIRPVRPADLAQLVRLCVEHARFERAHMTPDGLTQRLERALFGDPPRLLAWVVETGEALVGYASAAVEFSTWSGGAFLHMDCLYLQGPMRVDGLGRRLLGEVLAAARRAGCDEVQWQTPAWNRPAIGFYRALGAEAAEKLRFRLAVGQ